jgi:hypothetical protein
VGLVVHVVGRLFDWNGEARIRIKSLDNVPTTSDEIQLWEQRTAFRSSFLDVRWNPPQPTVAMRPDQSTVVTRPAALPILFARRKRKPRGPRGPRAPRRKSPLSAPHAPDAVGRVPRAL